MILRPHGQHVEQDVRPPAELLPPDLIDVVEELVREGVVQAGRRVLVLGILVFCVELGCGSLAQVELPVREADDLVHGVVCR